MPEHDQREAFDLQDYDVDGMLSGDFHVYGEYERPHGFGSMTIARGTAYDEPFSEATASLQFEGEGVRLNGIEMKKGGGTGTSKLELAKQAARNPLSQFASVIQPMTLQPLRDRAPALAFLVDESDDGDRRQHRRGHERCENGDRDGGPQGSRDMHQRRSYCDCSEEQKDSDGDLRKAQEAAAAVFEGV